MPESNTLLLIAPDWAPTPWIEALREELPGRPIRLWPDIGNVADVRYGLVWNPPTGLLADFPNLEIIFSLGAGVDHIFRDATLPEVPIVRIVDPDLTTRMSEYVLLQVLLIQRQHHAYDALQRLKTWKELPQPAASEVRVGIMGLGELGRDAAHKLTALGFQVNGWSRSEKDIDGLTCFAGNAALAGFLRQTDILVCLLPLTEETRGILNRALIDRLSQGGALGGPYLINAGRGKCQNEADILSALNDGTLKGVVLDVFETEPLPTDSSLWDHPAVTVTPHVAAVSNPLALSRNIAQQIKAFEAGEPLQNVVDPAKGY